MVPHFLGSRNQKLMLALYFLTFFTKTLVSQNKENKSKFMVCAQFKLHMQVSTDWSYSERRVHCHLFFK